MNETNLKELLQKYSRHKVRGKHYGTVKGATWNAQQAKEDECLFYHFLEGSSDSEYLKRIKATKSRLIISNKEIESELHGKMHISLGEDSFFRIQGEILQAFYPIEKTPLLIGVTGTNGKSTVVHLAMQISNLIGKRAITIGTLGVQGINGVLSDNANMTSPPYCELHKSVWKYGLEQDAIFIEVSSHALEQKRLGLFSLAVSGWINLTQDHLDYHKTMQDYFKSKERIFQYLESDQAKCFFPRSQRALFDRISDSRKELTAKLESYSLINVPDVLNSGFNRQNLEMALSLTNELWGPLPELNCEDICVPKGRFDVLTHSGRRVIVDYAHTPDALANVCREARDVFNPQKLVVLFGCGGDRDRGKRAMMGQVALEHADHSIITSDNPRSENPSAIIDDILQAYSDEKLYTVCENREEAISLGISLLKEDDVLIVAGKGHEDYQIVGTTKMPFDDVEKAKKYLEQV